MRHDPVGDLRRALAEALTHDRFLGAEEAGRWVDRALRQYVHCENVGGPRFELLNVTVRWRALCASTTGGSVEQPGGRFAGAPLVGALRWCDAMKHHHLANPTRDFSEVEIDPVEAATCMALAERTGSTPRASANERLIALSERVGAILAKPGFDPVDAARLRRAMDRLRKLRCVTPEAGWWGLPETLRYQVPEE